MESKPPFTHDPSATAAFAALGEDPYQSVTGRRLRAVVIGGGTGAPVSIRTLLSMDIDTNAVVAMADDGGSTGVLREEAKASPPGDVRKCITAMAADPDDALTRAFKCRFTFADNHTLGNLMLSALEAVTGSFPEAIATCEELLDARGHVYPSTLDRVRLAARTRDGRDIEGQAVACHSRCALERVELRSDGPIVAYGPALDAIREADLIVLGPGSLYTSIIPNLLVPGVVDAVRESEGVVVFVCSLADMQGETWGLSALEHFQALLDHGMEGLIDYVLVHSATPLRPGGPEGEAPAPAPAAAASGPQDGGARPGYIRPVRIDQGDVLAIREAGPAVIVRNLVDPEHPTWHDPKALRDAFAEVLRLCRSRRM